MKQNANAPSEREGGKRGGGVVLIIIISSPGGWRHGIVGVQDGNNGRIFEFTL